MSGAADTPLYTWPAVEPGGSPQAKVRRMQAITREEEVTREMIGTRCERGAEIARMLELPDPTAEAIRGAYGMALKRRGRWFDPALVDALSASATTRRSGVRWRTRARCRPWRAGSRATASCSPTTASSTASPRPSPA